MSRIKLSDLIVARAEMPDGKVDHVLWDQDVTGFGLRIRPSGKSWILAYRPNASGRSGVFKRMKLAAFPSVSSTSEARNLARIALGNIARGGDPLAERREGRTAEKAKVSVLLDRYERDLERRGYVNAKLVVRLLRRRMSPFLNRDLRSLTGAELAKVAEVIEESGRPGAAADYRSRARAFLTWCVTKARVLSSNPLAGHRKERATRADRVAKAERGRALSDRELEQFVLSADVSTVNGRLMRFLVLTGCRRSEAAGLAWGMVSRKDRVRRFPAAFVKQGRGHDVPITPALEFILDGCPVMRGPILCLPPSHRRPDIRLDADR